MYWQKNLEFNSKLKGLKNPHPLQISIAIIAYLLQSILNSLLLLLL